eukprot:UN3332
MANHNPACLPKSSSDASFPAFTWYSTNSDFEIPPSLPKPKNFPLSIWSKIWSIIAFASGSSLFDASCWNSSLESFPDLSSSTASKTWLIISSRLVPSGHLKGSGALLPFWPILPVPRFRWKSQAPRTESDLSLSQNGLSQNGYGFE